MASFEWEWEHCPSSPPKYDGWQGDAGGPVSSEAKWLMRFRVGKEVSDWTLGSQSKALFRIVRGEVPIKQCSWHWSRTRRCYHFSSKLHSSTGPESSSCLVFHVSNLRQIVHPGFTVQSPVDLQSGPCQDINGRYGHSMLSVQFTLMDNLQHHVGQGFAILWLPRKWIQFSLEVLLTKMCKIHIHLKGWDIFFLPITNFAV